MYEASTTDFLSENPHPFMNLLENVQWEIARRSLRSGGWANGTASAAGIETTCYAMMALGKQEHTHRALDLLLSLQNTDGSWPAFEGDDAEGCWVTSLVLIALRHMESSLAPMERGLRWLIDHQGREAHWLWRWKFRTVDRNVQFNPDKYGWPWFPGTLSWVIPTALSLLALRQTSPCCRTKKAADRIRSGTEMLCDRACPGGGWNAGNGIVFGSPLRAYIDATAIALLALTEDSSAPTLLALDWLRRASGECGSVYSLSWSLLALLAHGDQASSELFPRLATRLSSGRSTLDVETLSIAVIAVKAYESNDNPFIPGIRK
jgi:hypothetical protein